MGAFSTMRSKVSSSAKTPEQKAKALTDINEREQLNLKNVLDEGQYAQYLELAKGLTKQ